MWRLLLCTVGITALNVTFDADFAMDISLRHSTAVLSFYCRGPGWCGIALGPGMNHTDNIIVFLASNGSVFAADAFSLDYMTPSLDSTLGGTHDLRVLSVAQLSTGRYNVTLERPLRTADLYDTPIRKGPMTLSYAYSLESGFEYHYERAGRVDVDLSKAVAPKAKPQVSEWQTHGDWLTYLWLFCVPLLAGVMRAGRVWRYSVLLHSVGGFCVLATSFYFICEAYTKVKSGTHGYHARIGMLVAFLAITQACSGVLTLLFASMRQNHLSTKTIRSLHFACALLLFLAAFRNIWYGRRSLFGSTLLPTTMIVVTVVSAVMIEILCRSRAVTKVVMKARQRVLLPSDLRKLTQSKSICFLNQYVLDASALLLYHPGGVPAFIDNIGENIGKYLYSVVHLSPSSIHSSYAIETARRMSLSTVEYPEGLFQGITENPGFRSVRWRLSSKDEVARDTWILLFTSSELKCESRAPIELMGRYVMVKRKSGSTTTRRYYSLALCLQSDNIQAWASFAQANSLPIVLPIKSQLSYSESREGAMPLLARSYSPNTLSNWLCSLLPSEAITAKGPFGAGLKLDAGFRGQALAVVAGTGLVPFLDLLSFLWWKEANAQGFPVDFDTTALDEFQLTLCVAFHSEEYALAMWLLESLERLCGVKETARFRLKVWYGSRHSREFRREALKKELHACEYSRIWVCGPAEFDLAVRELVLSEGFRPDLLVLL